MAAALEVPIGSPTEEDAKELTNMKANDGLRAETERPSPAGVRIRLSAERRLKESGFGALRGVSCVSESGVLHLHGSVPSYYLKQLAQALVASIDGVCLIDNQIEVSRPAPGEATPLALRAHGEAPTSTESG
jgi:hypothetical protein